MKKNSNPVAGGDAYYNLCSVPGVGSTGRQPLDWEFPDGSLERKTKVSLRQIWNMALGTNWRVEKVKSDFRG